MSSIYNILQQYWGFEKFRPLQEDIITSVLNGLDTVVLLPTGGGKSLCFQVPALQMEGICIVISPLVALMTDQVANLQAKGIKAMAITGGKSYQELQTMLDNVLFGNYKFLYLSPERLQQESIQNIIKQLSVNCIAIDEAHCISQWGNDFRPAYKNISKLREIHPLAPIIALTATATPAVLEDTINELQLELPQIFKGPFTRPNLAYQVIKADDKLYYIAQILKNLNKAAIVYVRNRKSTVDTSRDLNALGIVSDFYHGGINAEDKTKKLEAWKSGKVPVMVATNAFGMGIDLATVAHVIHIQLPESIESYFQEAGRAGRDGAYATATIIYNDYDKTLVTRQFVTSLATPKDLKIIYRKLNNFLQIPYGEGLDKKFSFDFLAFCKTYNFNTLKTYNGLNTLDRMGVLQLSKEFGRSSKIKFLVPSNTLLEFFKFDHVASIIGKTILRMYGGTFETMTSLNLTLLQKKSNRSINTIIDTLKRMEAAKLISLEVQTTDASITFLKPREDDKTINVIAREVKTHNEKKASQVADVLTYIENTSMCRSIQLTHYFGDVNTSPCGICSVCSNDKGALTNTEIFKIKEQILHKLENNALNSRDLCASLTYNDDKVLQVLQKLIMNKRIGIDIQNRYFIY